MPEEQEQATAESELSELARSIEHLDKAAANVRQVVYRLRPLLRSNGSPSDAPSPRKGEVKPRRRFNARRRND